MQCYQGGIYNPWDHKSGYFQDFKVPTPSFLNINSTETLFLPGPEVSRPEETLCVGQLCLSLAALIILGVLDFDFLFLVPEDVP